MLRHRRQDLLECKFMQWFSISVHGVTAEVVRLLPPAPHSVPGSFMRVSDEDRSATAEDAFPFRTFLQLPLTNLIAPSPHARLEPSI
jgi:hypothetical protein